MQWYVDSWAVRDGFAFASYRDAGNIKGAERTVFIGVPDLVPVPIGRVSTGLWATRGNFQDRFLNAFDEEIAFPDLDQVVELVRRAYLAAGIGPGPTVEGGEGTGPRPERGGGDAHLEDYLNQSLPVNKWNPQLHPTSNKLEREERFHKILQDADVVETLFDHLRVFGEATLIKWAEELEQARGRGASLAEFARWQQTLYRMDLWQSSDPYHNIGRHSPAFHAVFHATESWVNRQHTRGFVPSWLTSPTHEQIVLSVPCPLLPNWDKRIMRLADKLFLALSTADYFEYNNELAHFIPSLLAALAIVVQTEEERFRWTGIDARRERLEAAFDWMSREMPQIRLPDDAEEALSEFAWGELSRRLH